MHIYQIIYTHGVYEVCNKIEIYQLKTNSMSVIVLPLHPFQSHSESVVASILMHPRPIYVARENMIN